MPPATHEAVASAASVTAPPVAKSTLVQLPDSAIQEFLSLVPVPDSSVLTLPQAQAIVADPTLRSDPRRKDAEYLVASVGPIQSLCPSTGRVAKSPKKAIAVGIALSADPRQAFRSYDHAQRALCQAAAAANNHMPAHVIIPHFGRWTFVFIPESTLSRFLHILDHLRDTFPDLEVTRRSPAEVSVELSVRDAEHAINCMGRESRVIMSLAASSSHGAPLERRQGLRIALLAERKALRQALNDRCQAPQKAQAANDPPAPTQLSFN